MEGKERPGLKFSQWVPQILCQVFPKQLLIGGPSSFTGMSWCAFWLAQEGILLAEGTSISSITCSSLDFGVPWDLEVIKTSIDAMPVSPGVNKHSRKRKTGSEAKTESAVLGILLVWGQK